MDQSTLIMLISLTSLLIIALDYVIIVGGNSKSSRLFVKLSFIASIWSISQALLISTQSDKVANFLIRFQYILGIFIASGFVIFSQVYPFDSKTNKRTITYLAIVSTLISLLYIFTDLLMIGVIKIGGLGTWSWQFGPLHPLFDIVFVVLWIYALNNIRLKYKTAKGLDKLNSAFMFWGLTLGIIPPALANIILPTFGIYNLNWTGPIFSSIWIFVIGFSIMRFQQMNVRLVIIEIIAIAMSALLFINIFIEAKIGRVETFVLFVTFLSLSITLVKTVISEVKSKQQLKILNETLDQKVKEQTAEISNAYEKELEARKALEKLNITKNQFIMITQHGIRTPINNIKQQLVKVLKLIPKTKKKTISEPISILDENMARLESVNDDFVNLTNSNSNEKILNLEKTQPLELIDNAVREYNREIKQKKINITINRNQSDWPECVIDKNKIYNALLIFIENAIHYNKKSGQIIIDSKKNNDFLQIQIIDNGYGLSKDEVAKLNSNHFYRGDIAKDINPTGMGVGISVAKAIIIAHHGNVNIDSLGMNSGTTVTINLPIDFFNSVQLE